MATRDRFPLGEWGWRRVTWSALALGTALQTWLWARPVWVYRDQVELYTLGMELARDGRLAPFGKLMTGDFAVPGVLLQLLVGLPLVLWRDLRSPTLVLVGAHLLAAWLLTHTVRRRFGWRAAGLFLVLFWLSPWRLYHSGFLWEANYLVLPAALHLWACDALAERRRAGPSLVLGATLALTAQLHASVVILVIATALLLWRRRVRLHLSAALAGAALGGATLLPTIRAWLAGASGPASAGMALDPAGRLNSLVKALLYWLRLGSLDVGRRFRQTVFCELPGSGEAHSPMLCAATRVTIVLALLSVVVAAAAGWWLLGRRLASPEPGSLGRVRSYCLAMLVAGLAAAALSPVTIQGWHLLLLLPAACLPVALWIEEVWPRGRRWLRWALFVFLVWRLPAVALLGLGHPMYVTPRDPAVLEHVVPDELLPLAGTPRARR